MSQPEIVSQAEKNAKIEAIASPLFSLKLANGRMTRVKQMQVMTTYGGLLEGCPDEKHNKWLLEGASKRYQPVLGKFPVHIISSVMEKVEAKDPINPNKTKTFAFLPRIEIAAFFYSFPPVKNQEMHASGLIVVWHQDEREIIPCPESKAKLLELNWDVLAQDFEF